MTTLFDRLGISPTATPTEIKTAYHAKLREFPAHSHPQEFKEIRAAYEAIRKGEATSADREFLQVRPIEATIDPELLEQMRQKVLTKLEVSLHELIQATF
ncbi:molecular chaperone DnaJ [Pantanalinema rosaneae CENA516]|uniref:molecular chaperone DnaJ n=1 Tax=Pantanalinema rosaneae TaxID=1620701 RepID=UPI003D6DEB16